MKETKTMSMLNLLKLNDNPIYFPEGSALFGVYDTRTVIIRYGRKGWEVLCSNEVKASKLKNRKVAVKVCKFLAKEGLL